MRVCLIGATGHVGYVTEYLERFPGDIEVCGVSPGPGGEDVLGLLIALEKAGYACKEYENYLTMFECCQPELVVVACYFGLQARVTADALQRGISVLSDKPLATTLKDLELVREVYSKSNARLAAMFNLRYEPWFAAARELVRAGEIGDVRLCNAQKSYRLGTRGRGYTDPVLYGGTIPWVAIHAVDWVYWITGLRYLSVSAAQSSIGNNGHGGLESTTLCLFELEKEVVASVSADYLRPAKAPRHDDDRIRIMGTRGSIEVRDRTVYVMNEEKAYEAALPEAEDSLFGDFAAYVRGGPPCPVTAEDSLYITEVCLRAREAAMTGTKINLMRGSVL